MHSEWEVTNEGNTFKWVSRVSRHSIYFMSPPSPCFPTASVSSTYLYSFHTFSHGSTIFSIAGYSHPESLKKIVLRL